LRNADDASDILQETFVAAYNKLETFDGRSNFFTWIYRIGTNFALMKLRKEKRTILTDGEIEAQFDRPDEMTLHEWRELPLKDMLSDEFRRHLDNAVNELPEIYKSVFVLRDMENLSIKETGKILNISDSNVKIRLKRARMYLREKLATYMEEYSDKGTFR